MQYRVHGSNTIATKPEPLIREMLRMHLDLFRHYADEFAGDPEKRARFFVYSRALWDNMSSFHAGMFQVLLAQLAKSFSEDDLEKLALSLGGPEFEVSPNRSLAGAYDGTEPLSITTLSRKLDAMRLERSRMAEERDALRQLLDLRQSLAASRWVSLGTAMGLGKSLRKNEGKGAVEKLQRLREACAASPWLRWGRMFGADPAGRPGNGGQGSNSKST